MRFLDKIAMNRLIAIITSFVLAIIKIFKPDTSVVEDKERKRIFPWLRRKK
jgi:hypothetical protein